jgi:hypothetical protein
MTGAFMGASSQLKVLLGAICKMNYLPMMVARQLGERGFVDRGTEEGCRGKSEAGRRRAKSEIRRPKSEKDKLEARNSKFERMFK